MPIQAQVEETLIADGVEQDPYRALAAVNLGIAASEVTREQRARAKYAHFLAQPFVEKYIERSSTLDDMEDL